MSDAFADRVEDLVRNGDPDGVVAALAGATADQRRAVVPVLKRLVTGFDSWEAYMRASDANALLVAGAGCLPTAAQVASWLCRRNFSLVNPQAELIVEVLRARRVPWLGAVAARVADAPNRDNQSGRWRLAAALVLAAQIPPPATDQFVLGWLSTAFGAHNRRDGTVRELLRHDPFLGALAPRVFDVDGAGVLLEVTSWERSRQGFVVADAGVHALAGLAGEGLLDRAMLLDGCLRRFLKGERPAALRTFVELHDVLAPSLDEIAAHAADYTRLLADAHSTVAALAQSALRRLDDADRLDRETLLQAGRDVLFRSEKGLVKSQLGWLAKVAQRDRSRAAEVVDVVAVAFAHPALDLQERALTLAQRHLGDCDDATLARLAQAATQLGADLSARAAASFGKPDNARTVTVHPRAEVTTPASPARRAMPPPITSPAELAAEVSAFVAEVPDPVAWERALDALVRLAGTDRAGLRASLTPVVERLYDVSVRAYWAETGLHSLIGQVLTVVVARPTSTVWRRALTAAVGRLSGGPDVKTEFTATPGAPPAHQMLVWRLTEIHDCLDRAPVPSLVATPTMATGHIDPLTLVGRLATAEAQGWRPWPVDLAQALLRLPRNIPAEAVPAARRLASPEGRLLADWLTTGGPSDPVTEIVTVPWRPRWPWHAQRAGAPIERLVARLFPSNVTHGPVVDPMLGYDPAETHSQTNLSQPLWSAVLPSHREVVAANLLPDIATGPAFGGRNEAAVALPAVAECTGQCGEAIALALAYALGSARSEDRVAALDAALTLNSTGDLDGAQLGTFLGTLVTNRNVKLTRITPALTELAEAGATGTTWAAVCALLGIILPTPKPPPGTPDLLALASRVAPASAARGGIAGLPEVAARSGTSRLATEARRLSRVLDG